MVQFILNKYLKNININLFKNQILIVFTSSFDNFYTALFCFFPI